MTLIKAILNVTLRFQNLLSKILRISRPEMRVVKSNLQTFRESGGLITRVELHIDDLNDSAGQASGHYFHQDLSVAQDIHKRKPNRHVDIGGRFDGFVAHVASFREIDVFDVRDIDVELKNVNFIQRNLLELEESEITDSISCLHSIEHIGLGRYGDPIDPDGHLKAFLILNKLLKPEGLLYISFPIAQHSQVIFNKHRIFEPSEILNWETGINKLNLLNFDYVDDSGNFHPNAKITDAQELRLKYGCGIYTFRKTR